MTTSTQFMEEGKQQLSKFQFAPAESSFQKALKENPKSAEARVELARIQFMKERRDEGVRLIDEALQIQPGNAEALTLKGISFMQKKDWAKAVSHLEKARKADPKLEMIYVNLAKSHRELGHLKEAEEAARKAIQLDPQNYLAHSELGHILVKAKKVKAGMKEVNTAVRINPFYLDGYLVLGRFYAAAGKAAVAIQVYKKGLKQIPGAVVFREMLVGLYMLLGDFGKAYVQAVYVALSRNTDEDWVRVGICAITVGKFERAEEAFKKSLEINPKGWEAHYNLAELYLTAKLHQKAKEQYALAIQKDGKSFKPFNGMGLFLLDIEGNREEAKKCFTHALQLAPKQKEPLLNMALTHAALRENDSAEKFARLTMQVSRSGDGIYEQAEKLIKTVAKK